MMSNKHMSNNSGGFSLRKLFRNSKFLFIFSIFISLSIWVAMSFGSDVGTTRVITDIPITISLSQEAKDSGLQIFSGNDETASVTVSGNRVGLGSVTKDDIIVTAQTANAINTVGTFTLSLSPSKVNPASDFTITSQPSPSVITVYADYYREKTFNIVDNVVYQVEDNYYAATTLSSQTVTVSGPQSEIAKIDKVCVTDKLENTINSDVKMTLPVRLYDSSGYELTGNLINLSVSSVEVDITVLPEKTVTLEPTFMDKPSGLEINDSIMTVDPQTILIAGPHSAVDKITSINLDQIDFSSLSNEKMTIDTNVLLPNDCRNLSNKTTAKVTLDFSSMQSKTFTVTDFSVSGLSSDYTAKVSTQKLDVVIIGPESQIDSLSDSDIKAVIDTSTNDGKIGSVSMPVKITVSGGDSCWAYGDYEANLTISKK